MVTEQNIRAWSSTPRSLALKTWCLNGGYWWLMTEVLNLLQLTQQTPWVQRCLKVGPKIATACLLGFGKQLFLEQATWWVKDPRPSWRAILILGDLGPHYHIKENFCFWWHWLTAILAIHQPYQLTIVLVKTWNTTYYVWETPPPDPAYNGLVVGSYTCNVGSIPSDKKWEMLTRVIFGSFS